MSVSTLLDESVAHALSAKRIISNSIGYAHDMTNESKAVFAYMNGDVRPKNVISELGLMLLCLEDARRQSKVPPPDPIDETYSGGAYASGQYSH